MFPAPPSELFCTLSYNATEFDTLNTEDHTGLLCNPMAESSDLPIILHGRPPSSLFSSQIVAKCPTPQPLLEHFKNGCVTFSQWWLLYSSTRWCVFLSFSHGWHAVHFQSGAAIHWEWWSPEEECLRFHAAKPWPPASGSSGLLSAFVPKCETL